MHDRRLKRFIIDPTVFPGAFRVGAFVEVIGGALADAEFRGYQLDHQRNSLVIFMSHESWDEVPEGQEVPIAEPFTVKVFDKPAIHAFKRFIESYEEYDV